MLRRSLIIGLILWALPVGAQTPQSGIGYMYPAGGQQGKTVIVTVGGQNLRQTTGVRVSGEGVSAEVLRYIRPLRNIQREQRELLQKEMKAVRDQRLIELHRKSKGKFGMSKQALIKLEKNQKKRKTPPKDPNAPEVKLPNHPLLMDLENKSLRELGHIRSLLFFPRYMIQINRQLAEMVVVKVNIDADAQPGNRELRLITRAGVTNPITFQVGQFREIRELEPNNKEAYTAIGNLPQGVKLPEDKALSLPLLINGQIMPGDVDRFRFKAQQGQKLVIDVRARELVPYLADAVPGWFQATVSLYDADGKEVAFADDYRFDPDPVLYYQIPKSGEYELAIRDSIYRGREDFVYRVAVGELPFITQVFPLGGRMGVPTQVEVDGWNLKKNRISLDMARGEDGVRKLAPMQGKLLANTLTYAVGVLPESGDAENNNTIKEAQALELPRVVNGRIDRPGDVDVFAVEAPAGGELVAEVYARRLNSPLDSLVRITDALGEVVAWNDDHVLKDTHLHKDMMGLVTHHADSYLIAKLPKPGTYYVHITDTQSHGTSAHAYRLRISQPLPDVALRVNPSSYQVRAGGVIPLTVHALRKDGFDGEVRVTVKDAPDGFEIKGGRIPPGRDHVRLTLTTPAKGFDAPVVVELEGKARHKGRAIQRRVVPAEDTMQAFLYRHLVPADELLVGVTKQKWRMPVIELDGHNVVKIPEGGTTKVKVKARVGKSTLKEMRLTLQDPPEGISLHHVTVENDGLAFRLRAEGEHLTKGYADNLILEAIREYYPKGKDGKVSKKKSRYSMGYLPAIPFEIVN